MAHYLPVKAFFEAINTPQRIALVKVIRSAPHIVGVAAQGFGKADGFPLKEVIGHALPRQVSGHAKHKARNAGKMKQHQSTNRLAFHLSDECFSHASLHKLAPQFGVIGFMADNKAIPHSRLGVHAVEQRKFIFICLAHPDAFALG